MKDFLELAEKSFQNEEGSKFIINDKENIKESTHS